MTSKGKSANSKTFDVVGLNHRILPGTQRMIADAVDEREVKVKLEREPDNPYDHNAIKVIVVDKKLFDDSEIFIGYLRRRTASVFAHGLDSGTLKVKRCVLKVVYPERGEGKLSVWFEK